MPRQGRKKSRSGVYHIILRGVNKQTIFEDDGDKKRFLKTLKKYKDISKYQIYSYCLMDNHIHLLLKESIEGESISVAMKRISSSYVYWYNKKHDRCGHLFQGRFKSEPVETKGYFLRVIRYIHQNPIKAGLEKNVLECKWTSINEYLGTTNLVDIDNGFNLFSKDRETAIKAFITFMQESNDDQCLEEEGRVIMSDSEVKEQLGKLGIPSIAELQKMERVKRNAVLAEIKRMEGVSVRQVSRITGVPKSVIQRI